MQVLICVALVLVLLQCVLFIRNFRAGRISLPNSPLCTPPPTIISNANALLSPPQPHLVWSTSSSAGAAGAGGKSASLSRAHIKFRVSTTRHVYLKSISNPFPCPTAPDDGEHAGTEVEINIAPLQLQNALGPSVSHGMDQCGFIDGEHDGLEESVMREGTPNRLRRQEGSEHSCVGRSTKPKKRPPEFTRAPLAIPEETAAAVDASEREPFCRPSPSTSTLGSYLPPIPYSNGPHNRDRALAADMQSSETCCFRFPCCRLCRKTPARSKHVSASASSNPVQPAKKEKLKSKKPKRVLTAREHRLRVRLSLCVLGRLLLFTLHVLLTASLLAGDLGLHYVLSSLHAHNRLALRSSSADDAGSGGVAGCTGAGAGALTVNSNPSPTEEMRAVESLDYIHPSWTDAWAQSQMKTSASPSAATQPGNKDREHQNRFRAHASKTQKHTLYLNPESQRALSSNRQKGSDEAARGTATTLVEGHVELVLLGRRVRIPFAIGLHVRDCLRNPFAPGTTPLLIGVVAIAYAIVLIGIFGVEWLTLEFIHFRISVLYIN